MNVTRRLVVIHCSLGYDICGAFIAAYFAKHLVCTFSLVSSNQEADSETLSSLQQVHDLVELRWNKSISGALRPVWLPRAPLH